VNFLLIGGIGYVGGRLASYLKSCGHRVCISTRRDLEEVPEWVIADEVICFDPDNGDSSGLLLDGMDAVVYLAAPNEIDSAKNPCSALRAGGELTWKVLEALTERNVPPPFLYLSTFHVYGSNATGEITETISPLPIHPYALGRYFGECVVQLFRARKKVTALCVRLSNAFGAAAGQNVLRHSLVFNDLCRQAVIERSLTLKSTGAQKRNFIAMEDVVRAIEFLAMRADEWPSDGLIHLGSAIHLSILEVAEMISQRSEALLGFRPRIIVPEGGGEDYVVDFVFSIERLKRMGFVWNNRIEKEIDDTLLLYSGSRR